MPYYKVIRETTTKLAHIYEADDLQLAMRKMRDDSTTGLIDIIYQDFDPEYFGNEVRPAKRGERWRDLKEKAK